MTNHPNRSTQQTKFRELPVGQTFDWIDDKHPSWNSFFLQCWKTAPRTYEDSRGCKHRVGSIDARVFHVGK